MKYKKSNTKNILYELPKKLPSNLRILENLKIMGKFKIDGEAESYTQFLFQKKKMILVVKNYTKTSIEVSHPV